MSEKSKIGQYVSLQLTGRIKRKVNHVLNVAFCREMRKIIDDPKVNKAFVDKAIEIINNTTLRDDLATSLKKLRPNFNSTKRTSKLDGLKDGLKDEIKKGLSYTVKNVNIARQSAHDQLNNVRRYTNQELNKLRDKAGVENVEFEDKPIEMIDNNFDNMQDRRRRIMKTAKNKRIKRTNDNRTRKRKRRVKNKNINFDELAYQQEMERRRGNVNQTGGNKPVTNAINQLLNTPLPSNPLAAMSNPFTVDFNPDTLVNIVNMQITAATDKIKKAVESEKIKRIIHNSFMELLKHRVFNRQEFRKRLLKVLEDNTRAMVTKEGVYETQFLYKASQANCQRAPTIVP